MAENKCTSIVEMASEYVGSLEERHLEELCDLAQKAQRRADGCGCPQCRGQAVRLEREFLMEFERVYGRGSDHEEDWVWNRAGRNYFGEHWDDPVEGGFDDWWPNSQD
jgi:hypothetical protein